MEKRGIKYTLLILVAVLFIMSFVSAQCSIKQVDKCPENERVIRVSGPEGGHAALYNQEDYNYALCCEDLLNPNRDKLENINNLLFNLSDSINAHVGLNGKTSYMIPVYYGYLECTSEKESCSEEYPEHIASISDETNAHIGEYEKYQYKICCKEVMNPNVSWVDKNGVAIPKGTEMSINLDIDGIRILGEHLSGLNENEKVYFQVYRDGLFSDKLVEDSLEGIVDKDNKAEAYWIPKSEDNLDDGNYYAKILNGPRSENIDLTFTQVDKGTYCSINGIVACSSYKEKGACEADAKLCNVAEKSIESSQGDETFCSSTWDDNGCILTRYCGCYWNSTNNQCVARAVINNSGDCEDIPNEVGKCVYEENSQDTCEDDGFLSYSWKELWVWGEDNQGEINKPSEQGWIQPEVGGKWYYDPFGLSSECKGEGSNILPCPAAVKVPFYSKAGLIIAIIIIIIIYYLSSKKKIKKVKKREKSKKTKKKKK